MNKTSTIAAVVSVLALVIISVIVFFPNNSIPPNPNPTPTPETPVTPSTPPPTSATGTPVTPVTPATPQTHVLSYGDVTLKLNQTAVFKSISVRPLSIEEDSRCPVDVQCIWAGTVRVKVEIVAGMGTSTSILKLGEVFTTEGENVTLSSVTPIKNSKINITKEDYLLTFTVKPQGVVKNPEVQGKCYVGGCSAQLCSDKPDMVSTCEYTESYACYKSATCERQPSGKCGWTETPKLTACLSSQSGTPAI